MLTFVRFGQLCTRSFPSQCTALLGNSGAQHASVCLYPPKGGGRLRAPTEPPSQMFYSFDVSGRESLAHCRSLRSGAHTELSCAMQASLGNSGAYPASACFHPPKGGSRLRALRDPLTGTAVLSKHLFRRNASTAFHVQHRQSRYFTIICRCGGGR